MTLFFYLDGIDVSSRVRLGSITGLTTLADHGEVGTGSLILDDPDGSLAYNGWWPFWVDETDCASQPRIWTGYIGARSISRGQPSHQTGPSRVYDMDLMDLNCLLGLKVARGSNATRAYETEAERMSWLINQSQCLVGLVYDNGAVETSTSQKYDEADFRGRYAGEVLASMSTSGKNFYVYRDHTAAEPSLFYAVPSNSPLTSTLRISNVLSDYDATSTFLPYRDATLRREPFETYSGIYLTWRGGAVYQTDASTASNYIARDAAIYSDRIGRLETAQYEAARYLTIHDHEQDRIAVTVLIPSSKVGLIEAGQRISVRFTHLPGYEDFTWTRIVGCNTRLFPNDEEQYELQLDLAVGLGGSGPGGGPPVGPWEPGDCVPGETDVLLAATVTAFSVGGVTSPANPSYVNDGNDATGSLTANSVAGGGSFAHGWQADLGSAKTLTSFALYGEDGLELDVTSGSGSAMTHTTGGAYGRTYTYLVAYSDDGSSFTSVVYDWEGSGGADTNVTISGLLGFGAHRYWRFGWSWTQAGLSFYVGVNPVNTWTAYECVADDTPPPPGTWVFRDVPTPTPDGSTVTFTTTYPFIDGSLEVFVDRLDQTPAVLSYDGAARTFTLGFAPQTGELVECNYQAR
jgi:hypothetical protein